MKRPVTRRPPAARTAGATKQAPPPERAMGLVELDHWLRGRLRRLPLARNAVVLDGFVAAVVAGPISMDPRAWICPLLAISPDAFNTGGTPEFAAIKAVSDRHNEIGNGLSTTGAFTPIYAVPGTQPNVAHWCEGFLATVRLNQKLWVTVLEPEGLFAGLIDPIIDGVNKTGAPNRSAIPGAVENMRKHFQLKRYGTPHPEAPRRP